MKLRKHALYTAGSLIAIAALGGLFAPKLSAVIKAAFVEVVIPSQPYSGQMALYTGASLIGVGPGTGTFGISNITLTNSLSGGTLVSIFQITTNTGRCDQFESYNDGHGVLITAYVQAHSTISLTYPSPLVAAPINGQTCLYGELSNTQTGAAIIDVNGFVN